MRILFVSHSFPLPDQPVSNVGGMQRVAVAQRGTLARHPDVELVPVLLETSWKWTGVRTGPFLLSLVRDLPRLVREHRVDVVLFSSMVTASVLPLIGGAIRRAGAITAAIPVGRDVTLPNPFYQGLVPRVLGELDLIFPISHATAAACTDRGADPAKVRVVPCGVERASQTASTERAAARESVGEWLRSLGHELPLDSLVLLSVGRHQERKGFHWFVDEVMPRLPSDVSYLLAGSGPMTPMIRQRIGARGLRQRVVLLGQVSEEKLRDLYSGADIFVMPNVPVAGDIEGFGVVMLEAGAAGLPVVAANLEGIRDVITEGRNGLLVETGDAEGFAEAIESLRDPLVLESLSERARLHVEDHFGWNAVGEQYVRILSSRAAEITGRKVRTHA